MSQPKVPSRLLKKERQKMVRQTMIFIAIALVIGLVFLFLVLPGFVRMVNVFLSSDWTDQEHRLPPSPPIISAPPSATNSANLLLTGFGQAETELVVTINNQPSAQVPIGEDGSFSVELTLNSGTNNITAYLLDQLDQASKMSRSYEVLLDQTPPQLVIEYPENGARIISRENQNLELIGLTDQDARVYVNERVVFPNDEGVFTYNYLLEEGKNIFEIRAVDRAGNQAEAKLEVEFRL